MTNNKKIILFDIDYTMFNTDVYKEQLYGQLGAALGYPDWKTFYEIADSARKTAKAKSGYFDPEVFFAELYKIRKTHIKIEVLHDIFFNEEIYRPHIYVDVHEVLKILSKDKNIYLGILSTGSFIQQQRKVQSLDTYFRKEHIHIFVNKLHELHVVLNNYPGYDVFIVDDLPEVLAAAKKLSDGKVITIQITREKIHEQTPVIPGFVPDVTAKTLYDIIPIVSSSPDLTPTLS